MPSNTHVALRTTTVPSNTSSVTFDLTGITGYTDLQIVSQAKKGEAGTNTDLTMRFNGDSGTNYSWTAASGTGTTTLSPSRQVNGTSIYVDFYAELNGDNPSVREINIFNFASTTLYKTVYTRAGRAQEGVDMIQGLYRGSTGSSTEAITSISFQGNGGTIAAGSQFTIYGIAASSGGSKATGGVITSDDTYFYHTFLASGTFTPLQTLSCDVVSVGGGGGGGWNNAGGGGGGEVDIVSALSVSVAKTVTVGGGGATATSTASAGANGVTSSFAGDITSLGGGGGGTGDASAGLRVGQTGGSGGGGALGNAGGSASGSNTNVGGAGYAVGGGNGYAGGGGGGATTAGGNASSATRTSGAAGQGYALSSIFSGLAFRVLTHLGSGGSGGVWGESNTAFLGTAATNGGTGAREATNGNINPVNATANGGGGGGGGAYTGVNSRQGSNGGSGIVIVRYLKV
jgi:hypothetical protein